MQELLNYAPNLFAHFWLATSSDAHCESTRRPSCPACSEEAMPPQT